MTNMLRIYFMFDKEAMSGYGGFMRLVDTGFMSSRCPSCSTGGLA